MNDFVFDFALPGEARASAFVFIGNLAVAPLAAIPEPQTYAMLAAGLLLGFSARRRQDSPARFAAQGCLVSRSGASPVRGIAPRAERCSYATQRREEK